MGSTQIQNAQVYQNGVAAGLSFENIELRIHISEDWCWGDLSQVWGPDFV